MPKIKPGIGMGIKYKYNFCIGARKMQANVTDDTAPDAPIELYEWSSLFLNNVGSEEIASPPKYNIKKNAVDHGIIPARRSSAK